MGKKRGDKMKCDELEDKWFNAYPEIMGIEGCEPILCYCKADVDAAIDELKTEHHKERDEYIEMVNRKDKEIARLNTEIKEAVNTMKARDKEIARLTRDTHIQNALLEEGQKRIDERDAEITELKAKLEDAKATAYADSVDAGMRERRLRRALYKACANWAERQHLDYYHQLHLGVPKSLYSGLAIGIDLWKKMEIKCRAMAEKFGG